MGSSAVGYMWALGGGFIHIFYFHPCLGKIPILTNIFQMGWFNHQPGPYLFTFLFTEFHAKYDDWLDDVQ